jgi:hypothetical protein
MNIEMYIVFQQDIHKIISNEIKRVKNFLLGIGAFFVLFTLFSNSNNFNNMSVFDLNLYTNSRKEVPNF